MTKRLLCLLLCFGILFGAAGCSSMMKGDYLVVQAHKEPEEPDGGEDEIPEVGTYLTLKAAILDLVMEGREYGVIRLSDFTTDEIEAMSMACWEVKSTSPFGAYAVDHITHDYSNILGYYDMEVYITYRRTKEQIDSLLVLSTPSLVRAALRSAVRSYDDYIAISVSDTNVDAAFIENYISEYYYDNPMYILVRPSVRTYSYPDTGIKRILEGFFEYPFDPDEMEAMTIDLNQKCRNELNDILYHGQPDYALSICRLLTDNVTYVPETEDGDRTRLEYTAYGALMNGSAGSEGCAMAYKLLCDVAGIECKVVMGRMDGVEHAWNIIKLGEDYYHVDPSMCAAEGYDRAFLLSDEQMWSRYWWDTEDYEPCAGALTYRDAESAEG